MRDSMRQLAGELTMQGVMLLFEKLCFGTAAVSFVTLFGALVMLAAV